MVLEALDGDFFVPVTTHDLGDALSVIFVSLVHLKAENAMGMVSVNTNGRQIQIPKAMPVPG
jgi:hypothetical protein